MQTLSDPKKIRPPRFAQKGGFYPDDPVELSKQIARFYTEAKRADIDGTIAALVCRVRVTGDGCVPARCRW